MRGVRIGAIGDPETSAISYRAFSPVDALGRRGHDAVLPNPTTGMLSLRNAAACDAVLVFRRHDPPGQQLMRALIERGVGVIWDADDDFRHMPKDGRQHRAGPSSQLLFRETVRIARSVDALTVTTDVLRDAYESSGVTDVHVIENYVHHKRRGRPRRHAGIVVGWVAGMEHAGDARALGIAAALRRLQAEHADVRVECLGVDLGLTERYEHHTVVRFDRLPQVMAGWDIALAPIAPTAFNAARSNIKLKEYAASRVPWLASAYGPYANLGEAQGGRLVPDDGWYEALDALVRDKSARKRLAKAGRSWAKGQTIDAAADRYEAIFQDVVERAAHRRDKRQTALA